jgi:hypothetical protein
MQTVISGDLAGNSTVKHEIRSEQSDDNAGSGQEVQVPWTKTRRSSAQEIIPGNDGRARAALAA